MSSSSETDLILDISHVKYRNNSAGRSPIGSILVYREHVEWRDGASGDAVKFAFVQIKGQRVSPSNKSKVQLQICLHNDDQATFVFLNPAYDKEALIRERDLVKETLQQALISHRQRVAQLATKNETCTKAAELEAKQKLLLQNKQLELLYKHLVSTKLISPQDFWSDYYKSTGLVEEQVGVSGGFLAGIAQNEGANGVKLNLNTEIIQAVFTTYPVVERKHLELVPHEMTETEFWTKFFQSHYFHREREVLPNPNDPFAECVRSDEAEMNQLLQKGVQRKRFDFDYLSDNAFSDMSKKSDSATGKSDTSRAILVRRCNYLSERILSSLSSIVDAASNPEESSSSANTGKRGVCGFASLRQNVEMVEEALESADLGAHGDDVFSHPVKIAGEQRAVLRRLGQREAEECRNLVKDFLEQTRDEEILGEISWNDANGTLEDDIDVLNGGNDALTTTTQSEVLDWRLSPADLSEVRAIHCAVAELLKHFWTCFPTLSPDLEKKLDKMIETIGKYKNDPLAHAIRRFGPENFEHCALMIHRAEERYAQYISRRNKK